MILIGESKRTHALGISIDIAHLGEDGFVIKKVGSHIVLAGGRLRGSIYAVYMVLEKLGCRWYTSKVSVIPKRATITIEEIEE